MTPVLVLVAHGTARSAARAVVGALTADVRGELPGVDVRLAHVDVQSPALSVVMADVRAAGRRAVVVPALLSAGFHVEVDIAAAVDDALDVVTPTLAGDPALVDLGLERLREAGGRDVDAIVVAATGSSRPGARDQVHAYGETLAAVAACPVTVGWVAGDDPHLTAAVGAALWSGPARHGRARRVGVVSYLLAPGVFAGRARDAALEAGAAAVGAPLGPDPRLAGIVVRRFRAAAGDS